MTHRSLPQDFDGFSSELFARMQLISPAVGEMELYEFRYCLESLAPRESWGIISLDDRDVVERTINTRSYYESIQSAPVENGTIVFDAEVARLTRMLFAGLVSGFYSPEWLTEHFYFDVRGFYFLHHTTYLTSTVQQHFGGRPYRQFTQSQHTFDSLLEVGYQAFSEANREIDRCFFECVEKLTAARGMPVIIGIAGPTAAGKTEITARLVEHFQNAGLSVTSVEMDNFLLDRDYREAQKIDSLGGKALHLDLFLTCLADLCRGRQITTPRYDFITARSSYDLQGRWRQGAQTVTVEPGNIIFIEGNFPFLLPEVAALVGIKVVYLTDDDVRLKRKWRRDMDLRKKYDFNYFRNRYFREQFMMAETAYLPQLERCDLLVDTTGARLWAQPNIAALLESGNNP